MRTGLPPALELLAKFKDPVADDALVAAMPHLEGGVLAAVVDLLIYRQNTAALVQLLHVRRAASDALDALLASRMNELHPALSAALVASDVEDRVGTISLIALSHDTRSADLLAQALRHTCSRTRQAAADALVVMTDHLFERAPRASRQEVKQFREDAFRLGQVVCEALQAWKHHHQPRVLELALHLIRDTQDFVISAADPTAQALVRALQSEIEAASDPKCAEAVLRALAVPSLRSAAANAISRTSDSAFISAILKATWLVADPAIRHGCRSIRKDHWEQGWADALCALDAGSSATAMEFISATGGSSEGKADLFRRLLSEASAPARRAAFWQVIRGSREEPARQLLHALATRDGDDLSRIAKMECSRSHRLSMGRAPQDGTIVPFDQPPLGTTDSIRRGLRDSNPLERVRALAELERTRAAAAFKEEVLQLLRDASPVVRSSATSLVAALRVTNASYLVRQSLNDADPRVQANAVEVADALHLRDLLPMIAERINASDARLRANAVKFCAQEGMHEAGEALFDMLASPSSAHRRSALWVAERLHLCSLLPRIRELAAADTDPVVQRMALHLANVLALRSDEEPRSIPALVALRGTG